MADYQILVPPPPRHRRAWLAAGVTIVVLAVAIGAFAFGRHTGAPTGSTGAHAAGGGVAKSVPTLTVLSTTPSTGATQVPSDQVVTVTFSSALSGPPATPVFAPAVNGSWAKVGPATLAFTATGPFIPTAEETLTIPAGTAGPRSTRGAVLAAPVTVTFGVAQASTERLQQLLAQLGYLPLSFTPTGTTPHRTKWPPPRPAPSPGGGPPCPPI